MMIPLLLLAQTATATPAPSPPRLPQVDCNDANHRAFDFWVGEWDVFAGQAKVAHSRIDRIADCAISENFEQTVGPGGKPLTYHGRSISAYDAIAKRWQQFYVDSGGTANTLLGDVQGSAMVLISHVGPVTNRMTVRPNADGSVSQIGDYSTDQGATWSNGYDFTYRRSTPRG